MTERFKSPNPESYQIYESWTSETSKTVHIYWWGHLVFRILTCNSNIEYKRNFWKKENIVVRQST